MNQKQIDCFLAAARMKSFTKAGSELFFSQQTVSKYIASLEEELGVRLLERDSKTVELTEEGKYYYALFLSNVHHSRAIAKKTDEYYSFIHTTLRIGISEFLYPFGTIMDAIQSYRRQHPDLSVHVRSLSNMQLLDTLLEGSTSVALFSDSQVPVHSDIESVPIARECLCIFGPKDIIGKDLPLKQRKRRSELPYLQIQGWSRTYMENRILLKTEAAHLGLTPSNVIMMPNLDSIIAHLYFSRGITVSDLNFGFLQPHAASLGHEELPDVSSVFACRYSFAESPLADDFIQFLRTCDELADYR